MVDDRPNILLIMTDQQRWDSLGVMALQVSTHRIWIAWRRPDVVTIDVM